ncbi:M4 family metallopeptidase [Nafulsella turpanensis]|uniref:M4 family metallopeptidase n=1 Tax=Nafulsella turpanensis TaxID=1265690 RepID=UPI0003454F94|nr:M4 family metallopeptidase [Nafulsella turpanensis]
MKKVYLFTMGLLMCGLSSYGQDQPAIKRKQISENQTPSLVEFDTRQQAIPVTRAKEVLKNQLALSKDDQLQLVKKKTDALGFEHQEYQQFHKGIKVEFGTYKVHAKNGTIESINGEFKPVKDLKTSPTLSEEAALQRALAYIGAQTYMWETPDNKALAMAFSNGQKNTLYPEGELVIINGAEEVRRDKGAEMVLAYKFDIYAKYPLSRDYVYVNAQTGDIVLKNPIIKHAVATGSADTRYSGTRSITTDSYNGSFRLRDLSRGNGIETYDMNEGTNYNNAVDFTDNDNNWTAAEFDNTAKDNAALDAHWGAQVTYDYWLTTHNRNSFDNNGAAIKSYVHYDQAYDNAFWNGSVMTYGDGSGSGGFDALTSLDVAAHEIGHAVCTYTADLVYQNESGAMNEGFSDIWAATVEHFAAPEKAIWLIGEDINMRSGSQALRSMSDPNSEGQPDTYKGDMWYSGTGDNGGVHTNSGVLNHWFYILSVGKAGTNDIGNSFDVQGISIEKAAKIAYRLESVYLTSSSVYSDARTYSIKAAEDLFGAGSNELIQTTNAWHAVGIGGRYGEISYCSSQGNNSSYEWIAEVKIGDFTNASGAAGYTDFTTQEVALAAGSAKAVSLTPGFASSTYNEYWKIWIDYNKDGDFEDSGELVYDAGALSKSTVTGTINVPASAEGTTRMRVSMKYNGAQTSCETFSYGEVEDYTVTFGGSSTPSCETPAGLASANVTTNAANLSWTAVADAESYDVRFRATGTSSWTTGNVASNSASATGLSEGTEYEFQVRTNCAGGSSAYSASATFTTDYTCQTPGGLTASNVSASSATLNLNAVSFANDYSVRYRVNGSSSWTNTTATTTSVAISGLTASTTYEFQVATNCSNGSSAYSASSGFTTPSAIVTYCASKGKNTSYEWIDYVALNGMERTSAADAGYFDGTSLSANVVPGSSPTIYISAGFASSSYTEYWNIWIDFNQDGDFTDAGEKQVSGSSSSSGTLSATLSIPASASLGTTRMRVSMKYGSAAGSCETFSYGEVEDYTVNITNSFNAMVASPGRKAEILGNEEASILFKTYPNPVQDKLMISTTEKGGFTAMVYDLSGKMLKQAQSDRNEMELNVAELKEGVYFIKVAGEREPHTIKFIKE